MLVGFGVTTQPDSITIRWQCGTRSPTGQASTSTADLRRWWNGRLFGSWAEAGLSETALLPGAERQPTKKQKRRKRMRYYKSLRRGAEGPP